MEGNKDEKAPAKRGKYSGLALMIIGFPNFLLALITALGGFALAGILLYAALTWEDTGGDKPFTDLCIAFFIVLLIIVVIALVIGSIIAFFFALGVGGHTIGGYYGYKGTHFWRASILAWIGTVFAFLGGIILGLIAISWETAPDLFRIVLAAFCFYELACSVLGSIATVIMMTAKSSFSSSEKGKKEAGKKKKNKGKKSKKMDRHGMRKEKV